MEAAYETKQTSNKDSKEAIAKKCVEYINLGDSIFLDAGTTTCEIAKLIRDIPEIIIVTNDLEIAQVLKNSDARVYICGGLVQKETGSLFGRYATEMLKDFRFDVGFFGAASINEELQVTTPTHEKMWLKRQVPRQCARSYLVVDQSKFGKQSMTWINPKPMARKAYNVSNKATLTAGSRRRFDTIIPLFRSLTTHL